MDVHVGTKFCVQSQSNDTTSTSSSFGIQSICMNKFVVGIVAEKSCENNIHTEIGTNYLEYLGSAGFRHIILHQLFFVSKSSRLNFNINSV